MNAHERQAPAGARYDRIGSTYARFRRPDPRIEARIVAALGDARVVVNVGAGAGSYEPRDRRVVAVEPSETMVAQRPAGAAPCVRARAERLPFPGGAFDAALALLTIHHWSDPDQGFAELARVSARQVILTWDPAIWQRYWLLTDYLPEINEFERGMRTLADVLGAFDVEDVVAVPVPGDCTDGFCGAYWREPHRYLEPGRQQAISGIAQLDSALVSRRMERLGRDLADGTWDARHGATRALDEIDLGYRLVLARGLAR